MAQHAGRGVKNVFRDPDMVLSDTGLYEYVVTATEILKDISTGLSAAQDVLYRGLQSAGKREITCKMVSLPLGMAADAVNDAARMVQRTWRIAKTMIRGLGKAQRATRNVKAFMIGGQPAGPEDDE